MFLCPLNRVVPVIWFATFALVVAAASGSAAEPAGAGSAKVPVGLAWVPGGKVHVALRDGRSLVEVDPRDWRIGVERRLPFRPCSMVAVEGGSAFLLGGMEGE